MAENEDQPNEELTNQNNEINDLILDKIVEDPSFRERLRNDPEAALNELGVLGKIEELEASAEGEGELVLVGGDDVQGHGRYCVTRSNACSYWSSRYYCVGAGTKFGPWYNSQKYIYA